MRAGLHGRSARRGGKLACGLLSLALTSAMAQVPETSSTDTRPIRFVPTLAVGLTATDNVNLTATDKKSDLIALVSPGFQLSAQSVRLRGFANYVLTGAFYARQNESNTFYNDLNAALKAELAEDLFFVDVDARISPQNITPLGTVSADPSLKNSNQTEVTTVGLAPYFKGQIGGQLDYLARIFYTYTDSGTSQASDSAVWGGLMRLASSTRWARLGWAVDLSYREAQFTGGRTTYDQLNLASLNYAITPALNVALRGNVETSNLVSLDRETKTGLGAGLRWEPSPRTKLLLEYDQRAFGSSHLYSFEYRTPRTVWVARSVRSLSTGQNSTGRGSAGSPFDLLFAQFANVEPDPAKRELLVNKFMQENGIKSGANVNSNFLPSQVQLQDRNELSASLLGVRSTVVFNVYQTQSQTLDPLSISSVPNPNDGNFTWLGGSVSWAHKLTPHANLTLNASYQKTTETGPDDDTTFWFGTATWSYQFAPRATVSVTARRAVFGSTTSPYNESALLAAVNMQF